MRSCRQSNRPSINSSPQAVRKPIRDTLLMAIANETKENLIDSAQSKLRPLIEDGNFQSRQIRFGNVGTRTRFWQRNQS